MRQPPVRRPLSGPSAVQTSSYNAALIKPVIVSASQGFGGQQDVTGTCGELFQDEIGSRALSLHADRRSKSV